MRSAALTAAAVLALAGLTAGCGGNGGNNDSGTRTVERTKVQVVGGSRHGDGFDAASIYARSADGVVTVTSLFGRAASGRGNAGQGSGFVLDSDGYVATNAHVVTEGRGDAIKPARDVFVQFNDGNQVKAKVIGVDPNADVALVKVDPGGLKLAPLPLGRSGGVRVGEFVAAIGSPFGEEQSLSVGVVSATNRTIDALTDFQIGDAVQTDAAINRGNSGGPLLDGNGRVIGINSQIRSSGGGSEGVGFAVPVDAVKRSLAQLREHGDAKYGFIGISSQPMYPQLAGKLGLPVDHGALVADVVKGSPSDKAGIRGGGKEIRFQASLVKPGGDLITKVDGVTITRERDLGDLISRHRPGDSVKLELYRGHQRREATVELGERPPHLPN